MMSRQTIFVNGVPLYYILDTLKVILLQKNICTEEEYKDIINSMYVKSKMLENNK